MRALLAAVLATAIAGPAAAAPAELLGDHPLAGSLWHPGQGLQVEPESLYAAAAAARWVLVGEKHDNAEHHRLQSEVVAAIGRAGRRPALLWEMAEPKHNPALAGATLETVATLGAQLEWETRGWPSWPEYQPIAVQALTFGMPMFAADAPRELRRRLRRGGAPDPADAAAIAWDRRYDAAQERILFDQLAQSHCNVLPESALPGMAEVQRLRDAWMARAMREAATADGAILIAGAQHVREDRGVPWHLDASVVSIAIVEVVRGRSRPEDYPSFDPALFDYVWFTARVDEKDPCEAFRKSREAN